MLLGRVTIWLGTSSLLSVVWGVKWCKMPWAQENDHWCRSSRRGPLARKQVGYLLLVCLALNTSHSNDSKASAWGGRQGFLHYKNDKNDEAFDGSKASEEKGHQFNPAVATFTSIISPTIWIIGHYPEYHDIWQSSHQPLLKWPALPNKTTEPSPKIEMGESWYGVRNSELFSNWCSTLMTLTLPMGRWACRHHPQRMRWVAPPGRWILEPIGTHSGFCSGVVVKSSPYSAHLSWNLSLAAQ